MKNRTVEEYLKLPYKIEVLRDNNPGNPGWVARVVELPGCFTQANTFEELEAMIEDAMRGWLEVALEDSLPIPEPQAAQTYSGKFIVRVPKFLHRQLVERAEQEGASLNQFVNVALARAVGYPVDPNLSSAPQILSEIRAMMQETFSQMLNVTQFESKRELPIGLHEEALPPTGVLKFEVAEKLGNDYQQWLREAGSRPPTRELGSSVLDSLVD